MVCAKPGEASVHALFHLLRCDPRLLPALSQVLVAKPSHLAQQEVQMTPCSLASQAIQTR